MVVRGSAGRGERGILQDVREALLEVEEGETERVCGNLPDCCRANRGKMRKGESRKMESKERKNFQPDRVLSYFREEWKVLVVIAVSGLIYNLGLLAGPWFEGKMTGCLVEILNGNQFFADMLVLVAGYVTAITMVQVSRYIKRFYVRRFANNVNRRMKEILYGSLVRKSRAELEEEGEGNVMTKAILDVDDCVEGMRKFTTEIFDTGVALAGYVGMLLWYDWRLALLCLIFPPISYYTAEKMKKMVQRTGAAYKVQSGALSAATLDRVHNAVTYRVFGMEQGRQSAYEENLEVYEKAAVKANIWSTAMPPVYRMISMTGVLFILYFGQKNVLGRGWSVWTIAAFTTFLSCFVKLSVKSSNAAKLFNAVHKAQVSWNRIKPLLTGDAAEEPHQTWSDVTRKNTLDLHRIDLEVNGLSFRYPEGREILHNISFSAHTGQMIGITGSVACGKSTLGKAFLCEYPYEGQILVNGQNLCEMKQEEQTAVIGYLGHDPELFFDSVENNIRLGESADPMELLQKVCMKEEVEEMDEGIQTRIGNGGVRLSGGQAERLAIARTLCHKKPLIVLDDPFSALDKKTEEQIFANLKKDVKDSLVLLISHRLYLFQQMDQVIWMEDGHAAAGTHEELLEQIPEYRKLYEAQVMESVSDRKNKDQKEGEDGHEAK